MYDKEQIYDEKISPLMSQIIDICKENKIQILASFALKEETEVDEGMMCTTYLFFENEFKSKSIDDAAKVIKLGYVVEKPYYAAMTITKEV